MDGIKGRGKIVIIGATNRPDAVDQALRRPGRFDREIEIRPPDTKGRKDILQVHTRNMPLVDEGPDKVDLDKIAELTNGYTGADLAALSKEAAIAALRRFMQEKKINFDTPQIPADVLKELKVTMNDFMEAMKSVQPTLLREVYVEVPTVHWSDIGGLDNVKQQLREAVEWPMRFPQLFEKTGIRPPKGVLLFGPPGTGKTMLAKAVATESNANFIAVRGPEVLSKWVGESEKAIREVFKRARQTAPCVVFFDEIDAIAPSRERIHGDSGVTDRIVNQLLSEMDGIEALNRVIVIGATNRATLLDPALLRPGRFDRIIYVPPPDLKARIDILKVHLKSVPTSPDLNLEEIAKKLEGYTGADIEALVRETVMLKLRNVYSGCVEKANSECKEEECKNKVVNECMNNVDVKVTTQDLEEGMKIVTPSLTKADIQRYETMSKQLKQSVI